MQKKMLFLAAVTFSFYTSVHDVAVLHQLFYRLPSRSGGINHNVAQVLTGISKAEFHTRQPDAGLALYKLTTATK
jgi:hypothetical protein